MTLLAAVGLSAACSLIIDTSERQCASKADCGALGLDGMACIDRVCQAMDAITGWTCLGKVSRPVSNKQKVTLSIQVIDVLTTRPPEDLRVKFCPKLDVDCTHPLSGDYRVSDEGKLTVQVQAGFDGYVELTSPKTTPALFFVTLPVWQDTTIENVLPVVSQEGFYGIADAIGTKLDLEHLGHVYALASDCWGAPAAGVRFEIDNMTPTTTPYYMINNVPVGSALATDAAGSGGFLNLAVGFTRITGIVASSGALIGESGFIVRAGAVSYPLVLPSPQ